MQVEQVERIRTDNFGREDVAISDEDLEKSLPITKEELEAFLVDLDRLTERHRLVISGCGCCGSPEIDRPNRPIDVGYYQVGTADIRGADNLYWTGWRS